jgi:ferritin-like metal-binding protein YciE
MPAMNTLQDLFMKELRDVYDAERQLTKALPKMAKAATSDELRTAFETHRQETLGHVDRLERAFEELDSKVRGTHCPGMAGIIEEGSELIQEDSDDVVLDAGLIAAAQRAEHYEIAAYGTLVSWAQTLGYDSVGDLLQQTLSEEKATDQKLTEIAEGMINDMAVTGVAEDEEAGPAAARAKAAGSSRGRRPS